MIDIQRYFELLFDDRSINRQELRQVAEDNLKHLAVNNPKNLYDERINETQKAYEAYFGNLNDADTAEALQQSRTKSMTNVQQLFKDTVSRRRNLILNSFDEETPEYQEFFPHGATEYSNSTLENIETLMKRMITASAAHSDVLGIALTTEFSGISDKFTTARGTQLQQKGIASGASEAVHSTRNSLETELTKNVLFAAYNNVGNPGAAALFFDLSLLGRVVSSNNGGEDTPPPPPNPPQV